MGISHLWQRARRLPSSAFLSHSTNFFICSRKTLFPLARWASLYHFRIASSLKTSAGRKTPQKDKNKNIKQKKKSFQLDANSTDASAGAGKTNVTRQVDDINQGKVLAIISGHLASVTHASCRKVNFFLPQNVKVGTGALRA